jgi:hypothetical protein
VRDIRNWRRDSTWPSWLPRNGRLENRSQETLSFKCQKNIPKIIHLNNSLINNSIIIPQEENPTGIKQFFSRSMLASLIPDAWQAGAQFRNRRMKSSGVCLLAIFDQI